MSDRGRARRVAEIAAAVVVMVAVQLLRQPGARAWNTVWAEDGKLYASEAYALPAWSTLFRGYAGYAQFVPRVLALGIRPLPVEWVAPYFAVTTAVIIALLALFVYRSAEGWIDSPWLRATVMFTTALVPAIYFEVNANVANLGWPLLFASFWAFASQRDGSLDVVLRSVVVALTALTTPVVALLVPVGVVVVVVRRKRADIVVLASCVAALAVQLLAIEAAGPAASLPSSRRDLPVAYGVRVLGSLVFGERWLDVLWFHLDAWLAVAATAIVVAVLLLAVPWRVARDRQWFAVVAIVASVVLFVVPVFVRGTLIIRLTSGEFTGAGSRYVYLPVLVLFSGLAVLVDGSSRRWLRYAVGAQAIALMVICFGLASLRSTGPTWSSQLPPARARCATAPSESTTVSVPITPDGGDWVVAVPCERLVSNARASDHAHGGGTPGR
jgi:hypothetical protein